MILKKGMWPASDLILANIFPLKVIHIILMMNEDTYKTYPKAGPNTKDASNILMKIGAIFLETLSSRNVVPSVIKAAAPTPWNNWPRIKTNL